MSSAGWRRPLAECRIPYTASSVTVYGMARPKTKGPTVSFRLSAEADAELRRRAEDAGMTVAEWLEAKLTPQLVSRPLTPPSPAKSATNPANLPPPVPRRTAVERRGTDVTPNFRK